MTALTLLTDLIYSCMASVKVFVIQIYIPFKIISAHMRRDNQVVRKWENLEKNYLAHPKAELVAHGPCVGLEPTTDTAVR